MFFLKVAQLLLRTVKIGSYSQHSVIYKRCWSSMVPLFLFNSILPVVQIQWVKVTTTKHSLKAEHIPLLHGYEKMDIKNRFTTMVLVKNYSQNKLPIMSIILRTVELYILCQAVHHQCLQEFLRILDGKNYLK